MSGQGRRSARSSPSVSEGPRGVGVAEDDMLVMWWGGRWGVWCDAQVLGGPYGVARALWMGTAPDLREVLLDRIEDVTSFETRLI